MGQSNGGWTGGQFSLVRVAVAFQLGWRLPVWTLPATCALAVGYHSRWSAVALFALLLKAKDWPSAAAALLMAVVREDPVLSVTTAYSVDPGTEWRMSPAVPWLATGAAAAAFAVRRHPGALLLLCFPPALVPRRDTGGMDLVLYDGECGLCQTVVRFLVAEDAGGLLFWYAPLMDPGGTVVVFTADGRRREHSDAVLYLLERIGGLWRILAMGAYALPRPLRDTMYNFVSLRRHLLFGRRQSWYPLVPTHFRHRLLAPVDPNGQL